MPLYVSTRAFVVRRGGGGGGAKEKIELVRFYTHYLSANIHSYGTFPVFLITFPYFWYSIRNVEEEKEKKNYDVRGTELQYRY